MDKRLSKPKRKTPLNETRQKSFTEQIQKQEAARESTSSTKDLKIKPGDLRAPKSRDRNLQVRLDLSQRADNHGASNPGERPSNAGKPSWRQRADNRGVSNPGERSSNAGKPSWRPKPDGQGASNPSERPFNAGKEVPSLEGGGIWSSVTINNPGGGKVYYKGRRISSDDSSEQQNYGDNTGGGTPSASHNVTRMIHLRPT